MFDKRAADRMAAAIDHMIACRCLDARSPAADARLDYGEPYDPETAKAMFFDCKPEPRRSAHVRQSLQLEMWARCWDTAKQRVAECHAAIDQHADLCSAEAWPEVSKRLIWVLEEVLGNDPRKRGEQGYSGPLPWWTFHSPDCGTKYRGCAPDCPKDARERQQTAQELAKGRAQTDAMEARIRNEIVRTGERPAPFKQPPPDKLE